MKKEEIKEEDIEMVPGPDGKLIPLLDKDGNPVLKDPKDKDKLNKSGTGLNTSGLSGGYQKQIDRDKKPVKMTPSLGILQESRQRKTERDVEDEFAKL